MDNFNFIKPTTREIEDFLTANSGSNIRLGGNFFDPETFAVKIRIIDNDIETDQFLYLEDAQDAAFYSKNADAYYDNLMIQLKKGLVLFDEKMKYRKGEGIKTVEGMIETNEKTIN